MNLDVTYLGHEASCRLTAVAIWMDIKAAVESYPSYPDYPEEKEP